MSRVTHNFHMWVWWIFNWPVNKDSSSSKQNSAFQKVSQPARCSPHGVSTVIANFRWAPELAQSNWSIRQCPKPSLAEEETGSLRGHRTSYGVLVSGLRAGPTPTFPPPTLTFVYSIMTPSGEDLQRASWKFFIFLNQWRVSQPVLDLITISAGKEPQAELKSLLPCCLPSICSVFPEEALVAILSLIIFLSQRMASLSPQPFLLQVNNCSSFHLSPLVLFSNSKSLPFPDSQHPYKLPSYLKNCIKMYHINIRLGQPWRIKLHHVVDVAWTSSEGAFQSKSLELAFSHSFVVLESEMREMVDKDLLRSNNSKISNDHNGIRCLQYQKKRLCTKVYTHYFIQSS